MIDGPPPPNTTFQRVLWRGGVVLLLLFILGFAFLSVLAGSTREDQPSVALSVRPADAYAAAELASDLASSNGGSETAKAIDILSSAALLRDPTTAAAAAAMLQQASAKGDDRKAEALAFYGDRLSRRELQTQIWLIQFFLKKEDWKRMFEHFQAAASTSVEATGVLFPIIGTALNDSRLIDPLARLLSSEPWWTPSLLATIAEGAGPLDNSSRLFIRLAQMGHPPRADISRALLQRLQIAGDREMAARLAAATLVPSTRPEESDR